MKEVLKKLNTKREELDSCNLYHFMKDTSISATKRISFAPKVAFFSMSFGDLMTTVLKRKNPKTDLERYINTHCSEDDFHWKWCLEDLLNLGYNIDYHKNISNVYKSLWDESSAPVRNIIYTVIAYGHKSNDPLFHLILIEILEAGLSSFFEITYKFIAKNDLSFLKYFGETHYEAEYNHSVTSWFQVGHEDETSLHPLAEYEISNDTKLLAFEAIDNIFICFGEMYEFWFQYAIAQKNIPNTIISNVR